MADHRASHSPPPLRCNTSPCTGAKVKGFAHSQIDSPSCLLCAIRLFLRSDGGVEHIFRWWWVPSYCPLVAINGAADSHTVRITQRRPLRVYGTSAGLCPASTSPRSFVSVNSTVSGRSSVIIHDHGFSGSA